MGVFGLLLDFGGPLGRSWVPELTLEQPFTHRMTTII
ncbi:hypothetical protein MTR67_012579 [Solanum verrucosum]|uniref:Uncharacterized protein n=1 Tax=Solanum verrucosum TaxID=315347 RepID=A0AAF0THM0_SOLVR|nr:hypothetical protein MTR67_012579 [Solanum verrucosum]